MVNEKVKALLKKHAFLTIEVTDQSSLVEDLGLDSLDIVEIAMHLEDIFNISLHDEVLNTVETVGDIIKVVEAAIKEAP